MIIKKKLRNVTREEFKEWKQKNCIGSHNAECSKCVFKGYNCNRFSESVWINNKNLCSDAFLNQEIEVGGILPKDEKEYLSAIIKPFRERVDCIRKISNIEYEFIRIELKYSEEKGYEENISLPYFNPGTMYRGMISGKEYTLKDLDL